MSRIVARLTVALVLFAVALSVGAQSPSLPKTDPLYQEIAEMDRVLFDAFNNRDLAKQETIFARDIEFFHDEGGVQNYDQLIENTKHLFAQNNGLKRTLVPGSLEIYPSKTTAPSRSESTRSAIQTTGAMTAGRSASCRYGRSEATDGS